MGKGFDGKKDSFTHLSKEKVALLGADCHSKGTYEINVFDIPGAVRLPVVFVGDSGLIHFHALS